MRIARNGILAKNLVFPGKLDFWGEVPKVMGSGWKAEGGGMQWGRSNEKHANPHSLIIHHKKNGLLIFRRSRDFLSLGFLISVVPNPD